MMKMKKSAEWIKILADAGIILGDTSPFKATVDKSTGFLNAPITLARVGVQHYFGFELGLGKDRALEKIGVFRSPEEVFHPDSIKSFTNLVVTDDHPNEAVTTDNVKELQMGSVSDVKGNDGNTLIGVGTVTDKDLIDKISAGKVEVSVGYANKLVEKKGVFDGIEYEFAQTKIRANHLAIVDAGRCGSACKLTMDNKKEKPVKITIDGIEYDVENTQLAQAIQKQQSAFDAEKEGLKKKLEKSEKEKEDAEKEKEKAEGAKDAALKSVLSDSDISELVSERAELLNTAKGILGDKMPECTDCPKEIKTAVIDKVLDLGDLTKKSKDYVDAAYDTAVKLAKKASDSLEKLGDDFDVKDADGNKVTRTTARDKYMKDQLGLEEGN